MTMLQAELAEITAELHRTKPLDFMRALEQSITDLQASGSAAGLTEGDKVKDFTLTNATGEQVNLYDELAKGPVILAFYRGSWCPYCNRQLRAYQQVMSEMEGLGAQLIAISPQTPDRSLSTAETSGLRFQVLSDTRGMVAAKYKVLFEVPSYIREAYLGMGLNLEDYNGNNENSWMLPVPATFMIDEKAIVRHAYVNANFMQRMEPMDIVDALRKL